MVIESFHGNTPVDGSDQNNRKEEKVDGMEGRREERVGFKEDYRVFTLTVDDISCHYIPESNTFIAREKKTKDNGWLRRKEKKTWQFLTGRQTIVLTRFSKKKREIDQQQNSTCFRELGHNHC